MSRKLIRREVLKQVVAQAEPLLVTRDISEDERVRRAHPGLVTHSYYHAFVGGALSDHRIFLGIERFERGPDGAPSGRSRRTSHEVMPNASCGPRSALERAAARSGQSPQRLDVHIHMCNL
jgi:hypothetical protein